MYNALFAPVSANPLGFHHLAAVEWVLRCNPALQKVIFIPSNGRHPDPTKANPIASSKLRFELCRLLLHQAHQPTHSALAREAALASQSLKLGTCVPWEVNALELGFKQPVRQWEQVQWLQRHGLVKATKLHWLVGADLVLRMADEAIFSQEDLSHLAQHLHLHILERNGNGAQAALERLQRQRKISFVASCYALAKVPPWLQWFLPLSSTHIRCAAQAGDALGGMLTTAAAMHLRANPLHCSKLHCSSPLGTQPVDETHGNTPPNSPQSMLWQQHCQQLQTALFCAGHALATKLLANKAKVLPYTLCTIENSSAGWLTVALAAKGGASAFMQQSRFTYSHLAKAQLLQASTPHKAVSAAMVEAMAMAFRQQAQTHFCLSESGSAGPPDGVRKTRTQGQCWLAWADRATVKSTHIACNPYLTRREHQLSFALHGLQWAVDLC